MRDLRLARGTRISRAPQHTCASDWQGRGVAARFMCMQHPDLGACSTLSCMSLVPLAAIGLLRGKKKASALERQAIDKQLDLIRKALDSQSGDGQLQFPLVIVRAQDFLNSKGLTSHEELRRDGHLIIIDTLNQLKQFERKQRIVFFSHRARTPSCAGGGDGLRIHTSASGATRVLVSLRTLSCSGSARLRRVEGISPA